jgi:hypothetical protein
MEHELITFQRFTDIALANELAELLDTHHIAYYLEEEAQAFNPTFSYADSKEYAVKINGEDFEQVNKLLKREANESIEEIDKDYYLYGFTDGELLDVITKADEWNVFDVELARKLLAERGTPLDDNEITAINNNRLAQLKATEPRQIAWVDAGYGFAILGGVLGFFIGWHLWTYKKTLPNGERVYAYTEKDRAHGQRIFYLSIVGFLVALAYKLAPAFSGNG